MPMSADDKLQIQELVTRAYRSIDTENAADWAACFSQDGVFVTPFGEYTGRTELQKFMKEHFARGMDAGGRHFLTNFLVEASGNDARVLFYIIKLKVNVAPEIDVTASGDCLVARTSEGWLFKRFAPSIDVGSVAKLTAGLNR